MVKQYENLQFKKQYETETEVYVYEKIKTLFPWYFAADYLLFFYNSWHKGLCSLKTFLVS